VSLPGLFDRAVDVGLRLAPFEGAAIPKAPGYAGGWLRRRSWPRNLIRVVSRVGIAVAPTKCTQVDERPSPSNCVRRSSWRCLLAGERTGVPRTHWQDTHDDAVMAHKIQLLAHQRLQVSNHGRAFGFVS
jgi:hypothetical protein